MTATPSSVRRRPGAIAVVLLAIALLAGALVLVGIVIARSASSASPSLGGADEADGVLPDGVTVFDESHAGITALDPELLAALRAAAAHAADDGIELLVTSGWRSATYQQQLLDEAVVQYGSEAEAARWVATADTSAHVSGDAVDIGPSAAAAWLSGYGAAYGLCQTYGNERWHYELRPDAAQHGCPVMYADPTEDPRMR